MRNRKRLGILAVVLQTFGWPLLIGAAATVGYFLAMSRGWISHPLLVRYTAGHPVEFVEVALFFVALAAIAMRAGSAIAELGRTSQLQLPEETGPSSDSATAQADRLIDHLTSQPSGMRNSILGRRLIAALEHIKRVGSADQLEDELKYLSDGDADRSYDGYALVRMIVWATPMLGFLGTVIGITLALGDLSPEALVNSPKEAMEGLLAGLSVAFDTTALALTLSIVLMFIQFLSTQVEGQVLSLADRRANELLGARIPRSGSHHDPQLAVVERLTGALAGRMEQLVEIQAELWRSSLDEAHRLWNQRVEATGDSIQEAIHEGIQQTLIAHRRQLTELEEAACRRNESQLATMQQWMVQTSQAVAQQNEQLTRQTEVAGKVLQATGNIMTLERALNENLKALAGAKNFEDTVMSLSAAIQLLSTRLGRPGAAKVRLDSGKDGQERAA